MPEEPLEGTLAWAFQQLMNSERVCHPDLPNTRYLYIKSDQVICRNDRQPLTIVGAGLATNITKENFLTQLSDLYKDGWVLYKGSLNWAFVRLMEEDSPIAHKALTSPIIKNDLVFTFINGEPFIIENQPLDIENFIETINASKLKHVFATGWSEYHEANHIFLIIFHKADGTTFNLPIPKSEFSDITKEQMLYNVNSELNLGYNPTFVMLFNRISVNVKLVEYVTVEER